MSLCVPLSKGYTAIVDDLDSDIAELRWSFSGCGYALRRSLSGFVYMHRVILERVIGQIPPGLLCDHANGNRLDNRRSNLRIATTSENLQNQGLRKDNATGVRGVYWAAARGKWRVEIAAEGRRFYLGYFTSFEEAVNVRKEAEIAHFGDFNAALREVERLEVKRRNEVRA